MALLRVEAMSFRYPRAESDTLRSLSLTVEAGDFIVLLGKTGCGKSTLLRLIKREIAPHGEECGMIFFEDAPLIDEAPGIGFVFQNPLAQTVMESVADELAFGLENMGLESEEIALRIGECAAFFGIEDLLDRKIHELSGGEVQLVNLAAVMAVRPRLLLLDEPTSQLDPISANRFLDLLHRLNEELGITVVMTEHRVASVLSFANRVAVMENGTIDFCLPVREACRSISSAFLGAMPASVRLWRETGGEGSCPLTVREGVSYFRHHQKMQARTEMEERTKRERRTVLSAKNLYFRYEKDSPDVLRGASLSLAEGEVFALLGSNGGGKSTLLSVLSGMERPYMGKVILFGRSLSSYRPKELYRGLLGALPQDPILLFAHDTVRGDFAHTAFQIGFSPEKPDEHLASFGISSLADRNPLDLSGGELQLCAVALVMLSAPKVLLLDEPTKGLDDASRAVLGTRLRELASAGISIFLVTHDVAFAAQYADRCAMLSQGTVAAEQDTVAFLRRCLFYTTDAHRISPQALTAEDLIALCSEEPL